MLVARKKKKNRLKSTMKTSALGIALALTTGSCQCLLLLLNIAILAIGGVTLSRVGADTTSSGLSTSAGDLLTNCDRIWADLQFTDYNPSVHTIVMTSEGRLQFDTTQTAQSDHVCYEYLKNRIPRAPRAYGRSLFVCGGGNSTIPCPDKGTRFGFEEL